MWRPASSWRWRRRSAARLSAAVVADLAAGERLLDGSGDKGATALGGGRRRKGRRADSLRSRAPARMLDHVKPEPAVAAGSPSGCWGASGSSTR